MTFDLLKQMHARVALLAIGRSTLRNQGAPGVIAAARSYLRHMNLDDLAVKTSAEFQKVLDDHTRKLMRRFPRGAHRSWGGARKAMNIFIRDVLYSRFLCDHHRLGNLEPWLELPLDSNTYDGLVFDATPDQNLPRWPGVRNLDANLNAEIQSIAEAIAKRLNVHRVHLDVKYWRSAAIDRL